MTLGRQFDKYRPTDAVTPEDHARGFREYTYGTRQGRVEATHGRVSGMVGSGWRGLRIGAPAWTSDYPTRKQATEAMMAGRTWQQDERDKRAAS